MRATKKQIRAADKFFKDNPSVVWVQSFGFYSNGHCVCSFYWSFDEKKEVFKIKFSPNGELS